MPLLPDPSATVPPAFTFDVANRQGLSAVMSGIPMIRGTWFQYYEADWSKGYYTSQFSDQKIERRGDDIVMTFRGRDGQAFGTHTYTKLENGVRVEYEFRWSGTRPVKIEATGALLWAKALQTGTLTVDGTSARTLQEVPYPNATDLTPRLYGEGNQFHFNGPYGAVRITATGAKATLFDGRGYNQPWASKRDLFWLGFSGLDIAPGGTARASIEIRFSPPTLGRRTRTVAKAAERVSDARAVNVRDFPLIPRPKVVNMDAKSGFNINLDRFTYDANASHDFLVRELFTNLQHYVAIPTPRLSNQRDGKFIVRVEPLSLPDEGYEIRITPELVTVLGQTTDGLQQAMRTLAQMATVKNGQLVWPTGTVRDWPSIGWRGVHLFGGPQIRAYHSRMADRILAPLKYNVVVLQCERTKWKSQPTIHTPLFNNKEDLKAVFDMYRRYNIEPIPLIQSLGHMGWFFNNGSNLSMAVNPEIPFTIDPRKPGTKEAISALWDEAIDLLRPKAIHFGCDEINIRGMAEDPALTTEIWEAMMPTLGRIANKHAVTPIFWGDKGLAPGQAIDAAHGDDPGHAKRRRDALPRGAWIADWHYKNEAKPDRFLWSLNLWRNEGFWPIASTWFNHDNIRGFSEAAYQVGGGLLQTTWAGYENNEENMLREFRQVAAYVVAAEYAWSGRRDRPEDLGYDPAAVFTRLFFDEPSPLRPEPGLALGGQRRVNIGTVGFRLFDPLELYSVLSPAKSVLPTEITIEPEGLRGRTVALAMSCSQECEEGDPVGDIAIEYGDGKVAARALRYGIDLRTVSDPGKIYRGQRAQGLSLVRLSLDETAPIKRITLRATSTYAGLAAHGVTAY